MATMQEKLYRFEIGGSIVSLYLYDNQTLNELIMGLKARGILPNDAESAHTGHLITDEKGKRLRVPPEGTYQTIRDAGFVPDMTYRIVPDVTVAADR